MKRTLAILLAVCMIFVLCACGAAETTPVSESVAEESVSADESSVDLQILMEEDDSMINTYSLLAVNPDANFVDADGNAVADVELNTEGADALINWLLSEEGEELAANYGYDEYGEYLFYGLVRERLRSSRISAPHFLF